ncbi:MAG: ATP-binding cassette domain-containing protein [Actinobacteria bacterium]|nr:ATP-binding cassette domain-containing protein [Actinomycetota bacterium]
MPAITTDGLTRKFGDLTAVDNITFEVPSGGVVGFVGPNGSGKSTTIRLLLGLISATSGTGTVLGEPIESPERFAHRVGALIENPTFVGSLSAYDNLRSLAALRGLSKNRIGEVLEIVGLTGRENDKASTFSLGMKQRLGIAAALLPDPDLLVLDEPTNGLDPAGIVEIRNLLKAVAEGGRTVLVSSHLLGEIQAMVDNLVVIRFGKLLYSGTLEQLMTDAVEQVVASPEHFEDMPRLIAAVDSEGWSHSTTGNELAVNISADRSPDLDRVAHEAGLTLRMLTPRQDDLEDIFLKLTGATDAELAADRSGQRDGKDRS